MKRYFSQKLLQIIYPFSIIFILFGFDTKVTIEKPEKIYLFAYSKNNALHFAWS